jgi:Zn finger protein HypA/HybF involved in hydrogenase expression
MHEQSFIQAILRDIKDIEKVKKLILEVGELAGIEGKHLGDHLIEGRNFEVEILKKESFVKCECGFEGQARILERLHDLVIFDCPRCGEIPEIIDGKDIKIVKIIYL